MLITPCRPCARVCLYRICIHYSCVNATSETIFFIHIFGIYLYTSCVIYTYKSWRWSCYYTFLLLLLISVHCAWMLLLWCMGARRFLLKHQMPCCFDDLIGSLCFSMGECACVYALYIYIYNSEQGGKEVNMHKRSNKRVNRRKREKRFLMKLAPGGGIPFFLFVIPFLGGFFKIFFVHY